MQYIFSECKHCHQSYHDHTKRYCAAGKMFEAVEKYQTEDESMTIEKHNEQLQLKCEDLEEKLCRVLTMLKDNTHQWVKYSRLDDDLEEWLITQMSKDLAAKASKLFNSQTGAMQDALKMLIEGME